jgi:hypothetical protein
MTKSRITSLEKILRRCPSLHSSRRCSSWATESVYASFDPPCSRGNRKTFSSSRRIAKVSNEKSRGFEAVIAQLRSARRIMECLNMHERAAMKLTSLLARICINPYTLSYTMTSHHDRASEPTLWICAESVNTKGGETCGAR